MAVFRTENETEFDSFAATCAAQIAPSASATVVALSGDLGAGKTTFTQSIGKALGIDETISSPTFVIQKNYDLRGQRFERLIHIDAYRLKEDKELEVLRWADISRDSGNLILVEWPEKVLSLIPKDAMRIRFDIDGDARIITIDDGKESSKKDE